MPRAVSRLPWGQMIALNCMFKIHLRRVRACATKQPCVSWQRKLLLP